MYKMVIVDDERIEREGMVRLVDWGEYGIEIVGAAWNGIEGLELIKKWKPDIVLTDIKMPVMNGIEMIQKAQSSCPVTRYIVLSGYGEYEYTSQAMELGVKYYILKPCDEEKLVRAIKKITIDLKESMNRQGQMEQLLPTAKEQFFKKLLAGEHIASRDFDFYEDCCSARGKELRLMAFRLKGESSPLKNFVIRNIVHELIGDEKILLETGDDNSIWLAIEKLPVQKLRGIVVQIRNYYARLDREEMDAAVSRGCSLIDFRKKREEIEELFLVHSILSRDILISEEEEENSYEWLYNGTLVDLKQWDRQVDFEEALFELSLLYSKLKLFCEDERQREFAAIIVLKAITKREHGELLLKQIANRNEFIEKTLKCLEEAGSIMNIPEKRMQDILISIHQYLDSEDLSMQWLAKEILYCNEDYLGRYFSRMKKTKFSNYLQDLRMRLVEKIMEYAPDILMADLSVLVGYPSDGQYFSRSFKKYFQSTFKAYKKSLIKE